ncbi:mucin-2-like isoform X2 [Bolinopsis microptera]|uniref:mucin-2-like isoform X2 n=1 Tax=Bolinopsis microptera TaxID=2820187 RepID=UPI003078B68F
MESIKSPTRKIRTQLEILLHSKKCVSQPCDVANCGEFKSVLLHMDTCKEGRACQGVHCASSTQILRHWDTCQNENCILCSPIRDNAKLNDKYSTETPKPIRAADPPPFQSWMRKETETEVAQPELRYQRQPSDRKRSVGGMAKDCKTSDNGFYGTGARTDNLSDEMKLSIREAVQTSMNNMMPQIEAMVRNTIRSEMATLLLGQGPEKMLQSPKPFLTSPLHYPTTSTQYPSAPNQGPQQYPPTPSQSTQQYPTTPNQSTQYGPTTPNQSTQYGPTTPNQSTQYGPTTPNQSTQYGPTTPNQITQYGPTTPTQSTQYGPTTPTTQYPSPSPQPAEYPPSQNQQFSDPSQGPSFEQKVLVTSPMPPKSVTPTLPQQPYPPTPSQQELTMTPPSQQALTMTPPSQQVMLSSPSSQHQVASPLFTATPQSMAPPSSMITASQHSPGGQNLHNMAPATQHGTSPAPSPARSSDQLYSQASTASPLDTHHTMTSRDDITSRQSLTSQLMAPSPQQQFTDQSGDQFMQSELHSYF